MKRASIVLEDMAYGILSSDDIKDEQLTQESSGCSTATAATTSYTQANVGAK